MEDLILIKKPSRVYSIGCDVVFLGGREVLTYVIGSYKEKEDPLLNFEVESIGEIEHRVNFKDFCERVSAFYNTPVQIEERSYNPKSNKSEHLNFALDEETLKIVFKRIEEIKLIKTP